MSFKSLEQILGSIQKQNRWQEQPFQQILRCWSEIVGAVVADHTRPVSIGRNVLWVATSSAVWAQELSFGRQRILEKLNARLPSPLLDIRFSTAGWQRPQTDQLTAGDRVTADAVRVHPSWVLDTPKVLNSNSKADSKNPKDAFNHWARVMQRRSRNLPLCPQCQCPTPEGELQRWEVCSVCAAKKFNNSR